jgi:hypothetical protein
MTDRPTLDPPMPDLLVLYPLVLKLVLDPPTLDPPVPDLLVLYPLVLKLVLDPPTLDPLLLDPPTLDPLVLDPPTLDPLVPDPPVLKPLVLDPLLLDPPTLDPPVLKPLVPDPPTLDPPVLDLLVLDLLVLGESRKVCSVLSWLIRAGCRAVSDRLRRRVRGAGSRCGSGWPPCWGLTIILLSWPGGGRSMPWKPGCWWLASMARSGVSPCWTRRGISCSAV